VSRETIPIIKPNTTTLKQHKATIDQSQLSQFIEVVNNAVWVVDINLHLHMQNQAAGEMIGWPTAELIGSSICELVISSNKAEFCQMLTQAIEERRPVSCDKGLLLARKKGRPTLVCGRITPILQEGQSIGAICAFWEVSPEKSDAYLRFEFANMASHLLRTPLSFIQASIEFLMNSDLAAQEQRVILGKMRIQSQRITDFTNELLKILRLEIEKVTVYIEAVAILPLIERVLNLIQDDKPRHVFHFLKDDSFPIVAADPVKVELILLGLLLNAVKRCPVDGHVTITFEVLPSEVVISVMDNGQPIPAELMDRIFWQFYPIDDANNKMPATYNLGLYNIKRLVELQDGRIWVESRLGQDSQFSFSLPIWGQSK
jgi:PAS domain S-box-containing protein